MDIAVRLRTLAATLTIAMKLLMWQYVEPKYLKGWKILLIKNSLSFSQKNLANDIKSKWINKAFKLTSFYPAWKCNWIYSWVQPSSNLISSCWRWKHLVRCACSCGLRKMKKLIWNFLLFNYFKKSFSQVTFGLFYSIT